MSKRLLIILALGTLIVLGGAGILIIYYFLDTPVDVFMRGQKPYYMQIPIGLFFGYISAKAAWAIVNQPFLKDVKDFFRNIFHPLNLNKLEILLISVCAGIGEEIFFRGAIQPMLGVWVTAMLFVFLHGYITPFNLPLTVYGIYMTVVIGVMGLMFINLGIITAISAHIMIDFLLMTRLAGKNGKETDIADDATSP